MLTTCPECDLPVSDKAYACPHCGYPLKANMSKAVKRQPKRMRLPNGFGQISEIKGRNLRNPFRAMVTIGTDDRGKPICKTLKPQGYFATYNEAYAALVEYNRNPYDLSSSTTVEELHSMWAERHYPTLQGNSLRYSYEAAWKRCSAIKDMRVLDIRPKDMKICIDSAPTPNTKRVTKILLDLMFDYAVEYDMVDRNYARAFKLEKNISKQIHSERQEHVAFTEDELARLWGVVDTVSYADVILVQCYMGWRPAELCELRVANTCLDKWYVVGGSKTEAGKARTVPIHENIRPLVKRHYDEAVRLGRDYLFGCLDSGDGVLTYSKYRIRFGRVMKQLNMSAHKPHDPRKTFVTLCKQAGVDEYAIKHMVGHAISDITESVYTDRSIEWLESELSKIESVRNCAKTEICQV